MINIFQGQKDSGDDTMKRLLASAALLVAISACSQGSDEPAAAVEETGPVAAMEDYVGAWNMTLADGSTLVTTNNADGTFADTYPDGSTKAGTWTFSPEQSCWTVAGEPEACYTISEPDITDKLTLTNVADQSVITATPVPDAVAPYVDPAAAPAEAAPPE